MEAVSREFRVRKNGGAARGEKRFVKSRDMTPFGLV